jgi:hypothetical protein
MTSALKAGWICFGIGLALSWFFPLANVFFSIAIITAIVAMCTHQVNRGLVLLLSSFCGIAVCALVFFALVVGTIGMAAAPAFKRAEADLDQMRNAQSQLNNQANTALQQLQASAANISTYPLTRPQSTSPNTVSQRLAAQARDAERDRARTREAVRQAEMQRDRINAKQQRIEQLQKGIDSVDHTIQSVRSRGGDASYWVKERDQLEAQKWDLQR